MTRPAALCDAVFPLCSQSHDARVMSAWEAQQAEWARQAHHLAAVSAKHPSQLSLNTGKKELGDKPGYLSIGRKGCVDVLAWQAQHLAAVSAKHPHS
jgi:hypothetical protein